MIYGQMHNVRSSPGEHSVDVLAMTTYPAQPKASVQKQTISLGDPCSHFAPAGRSRVASAASAVHFVAGFPHPAITSTITARASLMGEDATALRAEGEP